MKNTSMLTGVMAFMLITLVCCKRDNERIDLNQGANDPNLITVDTFTVYTQTVQEDSLITSSLSAYHLGASKSNVFGEHKANIALSFSLPDISNFSFPAGSTIDSVVLVLQYNDYDDYNGNLSAQQSLEVFRINQFMDKDSSFYSSYNVPAGAVVEGNWTGKFAPADSFTHTLNGVTGRRNPQIRITLNNATVGQDILNAGVNLSSNEAFQTYFSGLYVKAKSDLIGANDGGFALITTSGTYTGIAVYYNDTSEVLFPVGSQGVNINTFEHNYAGSTAQGQFGGGNFNEGYLNSMASTKIFISIPSLNDIAKMDNVSIVGAELKFYVDPSQIETNYQPSERLVLFRKNDNGKNGAVIDQVTEPDLYDGYYKEDGKYYKFGLASHVQYWVNEIKNAGTNTNYGFFLTMPADNPITSTRSVIDTRKGVPDGGIKMKLTLIKTK